MLSAVASMMSKITKVSASKEGRVYWGGWETIQQKQCDQWFCSVASSSFATAWTAAHQASLSFTISRSLLRLMSIESVMPSNHLILSRPLLLPPVPPSIFSNESNLRMRCPKYWSFSFSIIPSKEIPGLISFRMDWLDLLAVQGTLKRLLQHRSSKAAILQRSAFFTVQLSQQFSSVEFSRSVVSDCLQPHELQHTRLPCPSPTPRIYPNSCPLGQ